jgi:hypothetical protein
VAKEQYQLLSATIQTEIERTKSKNQGNFCHTLASELHQAESTAHH